MSKLEYIGSDAWARKYYYLNVSNDSFVHFTTSKRAQEIVESKKLLLDSPYGGMGAYGVFAISLTYGVYVPGVATTHIETWAKNEDSEIVAVKFKTHTVPKKLCYIEEVSFGEQDVPLINPTIITKNEAIGLIRNSPEKISEDDHVVYDKSLIPRLNLVNKKTAFNVLNRYLKDFLE
jgi:hypothetical protein